MATHSTWSWRKSVLLGLIFGLVAMAASPVWAGRAPLELAVDIPAMDTCAAALSAASEYGPITDIARAERDTSQIVAHWQERRHAEAISGLVSPLRTLPPTSEVTICLYRGEFVTPTGPPNPDGSPKRPHNLLRLLVLDDGSLMFDSAGYEGRMGPEVPSDFERGTP